MRRQATVQPHALLPRVVIQTSNTAPSAPRVPPTKEKYEPVAQHTRSKVPHTVDPPPPRVDNTTDLGPIAWRTRSQNTAMSNVITPAQAAKRHYPVQFLQSMALPFLGRTSGKILQCRQLLKHPKFAHIWNTSYANELGRLSQGVGKGSKGPKNQRVEGTNTFHIIIFEDIPRDRRKEICHYMVVCEVRPQKEDANHTRITVAGSCICYPGDIGTPTGSLDRVKIMINSVLYCCNARFVCLDAKIFYLQNPMDQLEYMHKKLLDIPQEFTEKYNLA